MSCKEILMTQMTQSFMKKPLNYLFLLASLAIFTTPAVAELELTDIYYGLQFTNNKWNSGSNSEQSWNFIDGKYGKQLNDWVSVEGRVGLSDNLSNVHGIINLGGYVRIGKDLGQYRPYGLLGYTYTYWFEEDLDELGDQLNIDLDDSYDESGFSYGLGIEIFGSPNVAITLEVMRAIDESDDDGDTTIDQIGLGFNYYFVSDTSRFNKNRDKIRSIRY